MLIVASCITVWIQLGKEHQGPDWPTSRLKVVFSSCPEQIHKTGLYDQVERAGSAAQELPGNLK